MQTPEFGENLRRCLNVARRERVVLMCAEAVPWRCHRSLIADALLVPWNRSVRNYQRRSSETSRPHAVGTCEGQAADVSPRRRERALIGVVGGYGCVREAVGARELDQSVHEIPLSIDVEDYGAGVPASWRGQASRRA